MGGDAGKWVQLGLLGPLAPALYDGSFKKQPKMQVPKNTTLGPAKTELGPGEKANLVNTSPQGVLDPDTSKRATLLGN